MLRIAFAIGNWQRESSRDGRPCALSSLHMHVRAQRILATLTMANDAVLADVEADAESLGAVMHFFSLAWVDMIELTQRC